MFLCKANIILYDFIVVVVSQFEVCLIKYLIIFKTIQYISYAEMAASVLTLQRSMLVSFGTMDNKQIHFMNATMGAVVCLFVLILGISMMIKSQERI